MSYDYFKQLQYIGLKIYCLQVSHIETEIMKLNEESLQHCKKNIKLLVFHCIQSLRDGNVYRVVYSIQTLSAVFFSLYKKVNNTENALNIVDIAFGLDNAEERMTMFIQYSNNILSGKNFINKYVCLN